MPYDRGGRDEPGHDESIKRLNLSRSLPREVLGVFLHASACFHLGSIYRQMGDTTKAKQYLGLALQLEPDQPVTMIELGLTAQKEGDLPEAVRQYSHAMEVQSTDVGCLLLAQALQQQGRSAEATAMFERAARLSTNLPEAQKAAQSFLSGK